MIYQLEKQAQTPSWADLIPSWFTPVAEDWMSLVRRDPFVQFRYAFRVALIYRYFHVLYQDGDYEKVFEEFRKSVQRKEESVEDWVLRLTKTAVRVKRYRSAIPFERFAKQLLIGTRSASFLIELRSVRKPVNPLLEPTVLERSEFDLWFETCEDQDREIA